MDTISDKLNDELSGILQNLNQDKLDDDISREALQEEIDKLINTSTFEYEEKIKFEDLSSTEQDFLLSRISLMKTLDRSEKVANICLEMLVVMKNPVVISLLNDANKSVQNAVKSLTDLHKQFHSMKQTNIKNKLLQESEEEKELSGVDADGNKISFF